MSVRKNQSKILKYCFVLLVAIQVWFDFYALTRAKNNFLYSSLRLSRHKSFGMKLMSFEKKVKAEIISMFYRFAPFQIRQKQSKH